MDTLVKIRTFLLGFLLVCSGIVWIFPVYNATHTSKFLEVHFLDVGQGDAIFIETPDGVQVLVDGGPDGSVTTQLAQHMSFFDRTIDMVVGTHPDKDHIGGLVSVFAQYEVSEILRTEKENETTVAAAYVQAVAEEKAQVHIARAGQEFTLGASTTLRVLFPQTDTDDIESNASSIVLQLVYGETEVLLTGDSPKRIEEYLVLTEGETLQSDILKVGHHGSRTSTSELFLREVDPRYAVISTSADNRYGHPHVEVTDLLFNERVETYSTAEEGVITFLSDGKNVWKK